jgi:hypothetical protein
LEKNERALTEYLWFQKGHLLPQIVCCVLTIVLCILYAHLNDDDHNHHRHGVLRVVSGVIAALSVYGIVTPYVYAMMYVYDPKDDSIIKMLTAITWTGILIFSSSVLTLVSSSLVFAKV